MARYRRFDPRFWKDEKVRTLTLTEKSIAIYGFTAQSNRIGIFSFSPGEACEDLELKPETFAKGFKNVCQTLGWQWEERSRVLYLPTWWKYNPPENANNVIGNLKDLSDVPHSPLISLFSNNLQYLPGTLHQTFTQTFSERYPKRSPSQEQYQEQYQEKEPPISPKGKSTSLKLPEWVPLDSWQGYLEMRKTIKRPLSPHGQRLAIATLDKLNRDGHSPQAVLDQSTLHSWQGLFAPKEESNGQHARYNTTTRPRDDQSTPGKYAGLGTVFDPDGDE